MATCALLSARSVRLVPRPFPPASLSLCTQSEPRLLARHAPFPLRSAACVRAAHRGLRLPGVGHRLLSASAVRCGFPSATRGHSSKPSPSAPAATAAAVTTTTTAATPDAARAICSFTRSSSSASRPSPSRSTGRDAGAALEQPERFLAISAAALLQGLQAAKQPNGAVALSSARLARLAVLVDAVVAQRMHGLWGELKRLYAPFDPDGNRQGTREGAATDEAEHEFLALLDRVIDDANMDPLPRGELIGV